jgi:hypothetical protein
VVSDFFTKKQTYVEMQCLSISGLLLEPEPSDNLPIIRHRRPLPRDVAIRNAPSDIRKIKIHIVTCCVFLWGGT